MKTLALAVTLLLLAGCATPYQSGGFRGGYKEIQLDENVFQISFKGNAFVSAGRVENYALLRSAEVALENGYEYFVIVDQDVYVVAGV